MQVGGGEQGSSQSSQQGFRDLPPEIQDAFKSLATQAQSYTKSTAGNVNRFLTPQSPLTTQGYGAISQGFAPNAQQYNSDIAMQQNPYDKYVIGEINRQAGGQNSVLQQNTNAAGQFGSNRQFLGANDIDLSRMNQIGQFQQQGFANASNNALNVLPQLRAGSAQAQVQAGQQQQQYGAQQQQAPLNALAAISSILGVLPTNSGQSQGESSGSNFSFGFNPFSDIALKENITSIGRENGYPVYEFNYRGDGQRYVGVMAQDIMRLNPEAVGERDGYKTVDYGMLGVRFRKING